jgi:hypothetical protein
MWNKVVKFLKADWKWLQVKSNRRRLYQICTVFGPAIVLIGFATPEQVDHWLDIAGLLLLSVGGTNLARKHS